MAVATDYPTTLPGPVMIRHAPKDRLATSGLPGLHTPGALALDYTGSMPVEFFFDSAQCAVFYAWWKDTLAQGGKSFNCAWPSLRGGLLVARFVRQPTFNHMYDGAYRVSAEVQIRGLSVSVLGCSTLYMTLNNLTGFSVLRGNIGIFSAAAGVMSVASQTVVYASTIYKALTATAIPVKRFGCDLKPTASTFDDAAAIFVSTSVLANGALALTPLRDTAADSLKRPEIWWNGSYYTIGTAALPLNFWYRFEVSLNVGVGLNWSIVNQDTGLIWGKASIAAPSLLPLNATGLCFNADAPNPTGPVQYRNCWMSDC